MEEGKGFLGGMSDVSIWQVIASSQAGPSEAPKDVCLSARHCFRLRRGKETRSGGEGAVQATATLLVINNGFLYH